MNTICISAQLVRSNSIKCQTVIMYSMSQSTADNTIVFRFWLRNNEPVYSNSKQSTKMITQTKAIQCTILQSSAALLVTLNTYWNHWSLAKCILLLRGMERAGCKTPHAEIQYTSHKKFKRFSFLTRKAVDLRSPGNILKQLYAIYVYVCCLFNDDIRS